MRVVLVGLRPPCTELEHLAAFSRLTNVLFEAPPTKSRFVLNDIGESAAFLARHIQEVCVLLLWQF